MKIITPPYTKAASKVTLFDDKELPINTWGEAQKILKGIEKREFFVIGSKHTECYAIAQPQASLKPLRYFVLNPKFTEIVKEFEGVIIVNPRLISKDRLTRFMNPEYCMSWPFRPTKKVKRFKNIEVEYLAFAAYKNEFIKVKKMLFDLPAIIMQHELQHLNGKNIYQK